jgi:hypothetical protein
MVFNGASDISIGCAAHLQGSGGWRNGLVESRRRRRRRRGRRVMPLDD